MQHRFQKTIREGILLREMLLSDPRYADLCGAIGDRMVQAFREDRKILFCGNGGSAADAQHIAAELSGRFKKERRPLFAEALHVNSSYLTAVANDYGYEEVYSRLVEAMGRPGDVLVALSTSGNSANILRAVDKARDCGLSVIGLSGKSGGQLRERCDLVFQVPSEDTARIQEIHITLGHLLCSYIEDKLFP